MITFTLSSSVQKSLIVSFADVLREENRADRLLERIVRKLDPFSTDFRRDFLTRLAELCPVPVEPLWPRWLALLPGRTPEEAWRTLAVLTVDAAPTLFAFIWCSIVRHDDELAVNFSRMLQPFAGLIRNPLSAFLADPDRRAPHGFAFRSRRIRLSCELMDTLTPKGWDINAAAEVLSRHLRAEADPVTEKVLKRFLALIGKENPPTVFSGARYGFAALAQGCRRIYAAGDVPTVKPMLDLIAAGVSRTESKEENAELSFYLWALRRQADLVRFAETVALRDFEHANAAADTLLEDYSALPGNLLPGGVLPSFTEAVCVSFDRRSQRAGHTVLPWTPLSEEAFRLLADLAPQAREKEAWTWSGRRLFRKVVEASLAEEPDTALIKDFPIARWARLARRIEGLPDEDSWRRLSLVTLYAFRDFIPELDQILTELFRRDGVEGVLNAAEVSGPVAVWAYQKAADLAAGINPGSRCRAKETSNDRSASKSGRTK